MRLKLEAFIQTTIPGNYAHHDPSAHAKQGSKFRPETDKRTATITCFRQHRRRTNDIMLIWEWMGGQVVLNRGDAFWNCGLDTGFGRLR